MNSYAANLAAAFTNHLLESNINSVGGLLEAPDIRFGCLNGATFSVLQVSHSMPHQTCHYEIHNHNNLDFNKPHH